MGNLTRDVELRYTPNQTAVTDVTLAVNDRRKSSSGEWVEEANFVDVTIWGRTAEIASQYLGKGSPVMIEGRLKYDTWETDGQKRSKLKVICERMQLLGGRSSQQSRTGDERAGAGGEFSPAGAAQEASGGGPPPDDEIPF
jgi:single-strand DNA-binding protein